MNDARLFYGSLTVFGLFEGIHAAMVLSRQGFALVPGATLAAAALILVTGVAGLRRGQTELPVNRLVAYLAAAGAVISVLGLVYELTGGA